MKKGSTLFLRGVIVLMALGALALCLFVFPMGIATDKVGYYRPIVIGLYLPAIPFFIALFQAWKLLKFIDKNSAFSQGAVNALKYIKYSAISISSLFLLGMPYIFYAAQRDDAPGVVAIGLIIIFASGVIGTFAAVLEKLLQNVVDIKSENELTV